jgi:hypothetical protein
LSAQYRISHQAEMLSKPTFVPNGEGYPVRVGTWDVGNVRDHLSKPVYEVAINIKGEVSVGEVDAQTDTRSYNDPEASEPTPYIASEFIGKGTVKSLLPSYKKITQPLVFFRLVQPPAFSKVKVQVKKEKSSARFSFL